MKNEAYAPTGSAIVGTLERLSGTAFAIVALSKSGKVEVYYHGETLVDWNSQATEKDKSGDRLFVDEDQCIWSESQLILKP